MYRFVGKKGKCYDLDSLKKVAMKLNYNCPDDYKNGEGEGSCKGYKPGSKAPDNKKTVPAKTSTKRLSSSTSRIMSSEETITNLAKSNDKLLTTIKNSNDPEEIKKLSRIVEGNNKSIEYFKNKIKSSTTQTDTTKVNNIANNVRSGKKITQEEYNTLKPYVEKSTSTKGKYKAIPQTVSSPAYKLLVTDSYNAFSKDKEGKNAFEYWLTNSSLVVKALLNKDKMTPEYEKVVKGIDGLLKNSVLKEDLVTSSGINKDLWDKIGKVGTEYTSPAYLSTTTSPEVSANYAKWSRRYYNNKNKTDTNEEYVIEFHLPKGTRAIATDKYLDNHEKFKNEKWVNGDKSGSQREVMIDRNLTYKVTEIQSSKDEWGIIRKKAIVEVI
jgi:hypothetical protein